MIYSIGLSPYDGVVFHESPIFLFINYVFEPLLSHNSNLAFILLDLTTCAILCKLGEDYAVSLLEKQKSEKNNFHPEASSILLSSNMLNTLPKSLAIFYLLNPLLVANCAARTSTVWSNLLLALMHLGQARSSRNLSINNSFISLLINNLMVRIYSCLQTFLIFIISLNILIILILMIKGQ